MTCERAREPAYNALNETEQLLIAPLRELTRANTNHSIAVALVAAADANRNLTDQELQIVQPIYLSLQQAVITAESNYQMVLNDEQPTINIRNFLLSHSIEDLIEVENIRFSVTFQEESPSIIPLDIHVRVQQLNKTVNLTVVTRHDSSQSASEERSFRQDPLSCWQRALSSSYEKKTIRGRGSA